MRIRIIAPREDKPGNFRLNLPVPLWVARLRFIWKFLPEESRKYEPIAADLVKAMKKFKRENGSWNLVEVDTADGSTHVLIRV